MATKSSFSGGSICLADSDSWVRFVLGSRARLIQISIVAVLIALYVIWWRR